MRVSGRVSTHEHRIKLSSSCADRLSISSNLNQKRALSCSASSQMLISASLPSVRDYERSDPIGMMHMNRSDISELGVRKRR
jgi:hypothetical protein